MNTFNVIGMLTWKFSHNNKTKLTRIKCHSEILFYISVLFDWNFCRALVRYVWCATSKWRLALFFIHKHKHSVCRVLATTLHMAEHTLVWSVQECKCRTKIDFLSFFAFSRLLAVDVDERRTPCTRMCDIHQNKTILDIFSSSRSGNMELCKISWKFIIIY